MGQWNTTTQSYLNNNDTLFESMILTNLDGTPSGLSSNTSFDSFGRLRTANPFTLFDSSHRYRDNGRWFEDANGGASASSFNADEGLIDMTLSATSGEELIRETKRVFSYQPGKSLLFLSTFVFEDAKTNLRQRVGYFGEENGFYFEQNDSTAYFTKRSSVTGTTIEVQVSQSDWNVDKLDGTGVSGITLDTTKGQILWMDIEWLGIGSVRLGFVIDGKFIHCHSFYHANNIETTYVTSASLPIRYEITNTDTTSGASTLKQICSTVISEGGYELIGKSKTASTALATPYTLTTANTFYPVISLQLKTTNLDAVVLTSNIHIAGDGSGGASIYEWKLVQNATLTAPSWVNVSDSSIQYDISASGYSGGIDFDSGFFSVSNQSANNVNILKDAIFKHQLERNSFTSTPTPFTIAIANTNSSQDVFASIGWEEV
jgi:hypothetical protein